MSVRVTISRTGTKEYLVRLDIARGAELRSRALTTSACSAALDAAALIAGLAIDPEAVSDIPDSVHLEASGDIEASAPVAPPTTPLANKGPRCPSVPRARTKPRSHVDPANSRATLKREEPAARSRPRIGLGTAGGMDVGALPGIVPTVGLAGVLELGPFHLDVGTLASYDTEQQQAQGGDLFLVRGRCAACWLTGRGWAAGPCAGFEAGMLAGHGLDVDVPLWAVRPWLASTFGGLLRVWHDRRALVALHGSVLLPWNRPRFELSGKHLFQPDAIDLSADITFGLAIE